MNTNKIMFITQMNPTSQIGGATVVMKNLLSALNSDTFIVCYLNYFKFFYRSGKKKSNYFRLISNYHPIHLMKFFSDDFVINHAVRRAEKLVKSKEIKLIVGIYPTYKSLLIAYRVAKKCNIKLIPYLHDIPSESLSHSNLKTAAIRLEKNIINYSYKILTISKGMSDYYNKEHNIDTFPLEHSYPEKISKTIISNRSEIVFWGGSIQPFNRQSFKRIINATHSANRTMEITNLQSSVGIGNDVKFVTNFYPKRSDYLSALKNMGVLTLAIDWHDESFIGKYELETIFPTRVIEYFASGAPILVHCPKNYFLAKFFEEHNCGMVIYERDNIQLTRAIEFLLSGDKKVEEMQRNALKIAKYFSIDRIASLFKSYTE